jgi:uncharacterized paraquat-inducible protein A
MVIPQSHRPKTKERDFAQNFHKNDNFLKIQIRSCEIRQFRLISVRNMAEKDPALMERAKRARRIVRNPDQYKVCLGCDSIVAAKVSICPNCHSYRYEAEQDQVVRQAQILSQREQHSVVAEDLF